LNRAVTTKKVNVKKGLVPPAPTPAPAPASAPAKPTASLSAILGTSAASPHPGAPGEIKPEWVKYYHILIDLRERLRHQMDGLAEESAQELPGYSLHMADSGTDNFDRDFALSLLSSDQDAMYEIEEALKRISRGTYGVCELTNKPIPKARLDAIPWARFTVEAQARLEKEGALHQRRLGTLGTVDSMGVPEEEEEEDLDEKPGKDKE